MIDQCVVRGNLVLHRATCRMTCGSGNHFLLALLVTLNEELSRLALVRLEKTREAGTRQHRVKNSNPASIVRVQATPPGGSLVRLCGCDRVSEVELHDDDGEHESVDDAVILRRVPQLDLLLQRLRRFCQAETKEVVTPMQMVVKTGTGRLTRFASGKCEQHFPLILLVIEHYLLAKILKSLEITMCHHLDIVRYHLSNIN